MGRLLCWTCGRSCSGPSPSFALAEGCFSSKVMSREFFSRHRVPFLDLHWLHYYSSTSAHISRRHFRSNSCSTLPDWYSVTGIRTNILPQDVLLQPAQPFPFRGQQSQVSISQRLLHVDYSIDSDATVFALTRCKNRHSVRLFGRALACAKRCYRTGVQLSKKSIMSSTQFFFTEVSVSRIMPSHCNGY